MWDYILSWSYYYFFQATVTAAMDTEMVTKLEVKTPKEEKSGAK